MLLTRITLTLCLLSLVALPLASAEWPAWRGPDSNAVAPPGEYPVEFAPDKNCLWQVDVGGEGGSTPVVSGEAIYLTATSSGEDITVSYDLAGNERWRKKLGPAAEIKHRNSTSSNSSPVTDGKHVVVYFKTGLLVCLTIAGDELWRVNLQEKYGPNTLWWDLGTSPVLTSAGVCIAVVQTDNSYLVTLDLKTGDEVWKTERLYETAEESDQSYATPTVVDINGREVVVTWGADHVTAHDTKTGELVWEAEGFNPDAMRAWRTIASATVVGDVVIVPYGRDQHIAAERIFVGDDIHQQERLWGLTGIGGDVPSPVVADGKVYVLGDKGDVSCLDFATGDTVWQEKLPRGKGRYYSSPMLANGNLYCLREDGMLYVVATSPEFKVLAENKLGDESVATPIPVDGTLLVRTRNKLFRFGNK